MSAQHHRESKALSKILPQQSFDFYFILLFLKTNSVLDFSTAAKYCIIIANHTAIKELSQE
jgi:hypothetical protein